MVRFVEDDPWVSLKSDTALRWEMPVVAEGGWARSGDTEDWRRDALMVVDELL